MVGSIGLSSPARAYTVFFGEDLNNSSYRPLAEYDKATQAEADFLSHLSGVGTATFETFATQTYSPLSLDFGEAGTATLNGHGVIKSIPEGSTNGYGRYAISQNNYWEANAAGNNFLVEFSEAVAAFGFYGVDLGDFGGELTLNLNLANGTQTAVKVPNTVGRYGSTDGSVLYFGLIADSVEEVFTSLSFDMTAPESGIMADIFAFDNMTVGSLSQVKHADGSQSQDVPEPASVLALFAVGTLATRIRKRIA
ncbi:MAG: PEP-CTERM sorting domain-containing protein [Cyanobacteria bacterium SID2]|nr:PEP-CTERM sorting domain-containing protein [Cyanobacteria bacterium SID2]MBP0006311.1 PEP-CTERM sorting domain-containing protein [Cyanobacteria bacterium SBC]